MDYLKSFKLFESIFFKMDIFTDKIESICDHFDFHYFGEEKITNKGLYNLCDNNYNGGISIYLEEFYLGKNSDVLKVQFFIKEDYYQENEEKLIENVDWVAEISNYPYISLNDENMVKDIQQPEIFGKGLGKSRIPVRAREKPGGVVDFEMRMITIEFKCDVVDMLFIIFYKPEIYSRDKKHFDKILWRYHKSDLILKLFKLHTENRGLDINWEPLYSSKGRTDIASITLDLETFASFRVSEQDICNMFPGFFDQLYENSGIICTISGMDEDLMDFDNGSFTPRGKMEEVIKKHNLDMTVGNVMVEK